jgi:protein-tyrosine-phosphatase
VKVAGLRKILVVGMQNTCRSIVTAELIKKAAKEKGVSGIEVDCAGVMAFPGIPLEAEAAAQLKSLSIEGEFSSKPLTKQAVSDAELIITMTEKIKNAISAKFPDKAAAVATLKELAGETDRDLAPSEKLGEEVKNAVEKAFDKIKG